MSNKSHSILDIEALLASEAYAVNTQGLHQSLQEFFLILGKQLKLKEVHCPKHDSFAKMIQEFAQLNHLKTRNIVLDSSWQSGDLGPLVVLDENAHPHVLSRNSRGYQACASLDAPLQDLNAVLPQAISFYPLLPNRPLTLKDLFSFNYRHIKSDLWTIMGFHFLLGLLMLVLPLVTGEIFDDVIPNSDKLGLWHWSLVLVVMIVLRFLMSANVMISAVRMRLKSNALMQSALWSRLMTLPLNFFSKLNAGDLADRAGLVDAIAQQLSGAMMTSVLSGFFSIFTFALMVWYAPGLSLVLFALLLVFSLVYVLATLRQVKYQRQRMDLQGQLYGFMYQIFQNIGKIQVQNRQAQVYEQWVGKFLRSCRALMKAENISIYLDLMGHLLMVVGLGVIYTYAVYGAGFASFGTFMIYSALYSQFMSAFLGLVGVGVSFSHIWAYVKRAKPLFEQSPERTDTGLVLTSLGRIQCQSLYFRYDTVHSIYDTSNPQGSEAIVPWVLKNISLTIEPGEFIALVGPSGSGKSTLAKLLLGLLEANQGTMTINHYDMSLVHKPSYRRQFGLVMQNTLLYQGSIWSNITADKPYDSHEVMEVIEAIGFKPFIESLPMGFDTVVSEGGKNLSVGQRQRLLIVKALLTKPAAVVFDEATSALDNDSQSKVFQYLEKMNITRIIVTHRLKAIRQADRIYVLEDGEIQACDTFQALETDCPAFQRLLKHS